MATTSAFDNINAAINQYGASNPWGADADEGVNSINASTASGLTDTLNRLKQTLTDSINSYNQQASQVPAQYQPEYNQHANQAALALRNVLEAAANRGDMGGMQQLDQLAVNTAQQNADAQTDTSKNAALQKITDAISKAYSDADTNLGSAIANANQNRISNISGLKSSEAAAAEKQYEAELAAQAKIQAAQINASKGSSSSSSAVTPSKVLSTAASLYGVTTADGYGKVISDPNALLNMIQNSGLSSDEQDQVVASFPYATSNGQSLLDYLQNKVTQSNNVAKIPNSSNSQSFMMGGKQYTSM